MGRKIASAVPPKLIGKPILFKYINAVSRAVLLTEKSAFFRKLRSVFLMRFATALTP